MAAAHFNRSNCHTVPTILSSFDVGFKGLQSCQRLSSDTSPAINCELKARQTSWRSRSLCFSFTQDQTDILEQKISAATDSWQKSFQGLSEGKCVVGGGGGGVRAWKYSAAQAAQGPTHTHTHKQTRSPWWREMAEDGWSGQGDMTAEWLGKISERQTSFPSTSRLMSGGLGEGRG